VKNFKLFLFLSVLLMISVFCTTSYGATQDLRINYRFLGSIEVRLLTFGAAGTENVMPTTRGTAGQYLAADGSGNMVWTNPSSFSTQVGIFDDGVLSTTTDQINFVGDSLTLTVVEGRSVVTCSANVTSVNGYTGPVTLDAADVGAVATTGDESIDGVKTFTSFMITPSSAPTTDYQAANKKYVDDQNDNQMVFHEKALTGNTSYTIDLSSEGHADGNTRRIVKVIETATGIDISNGVQVIMDTADEIDIEVGATNLDVTVLYNTY